MIQNFKKDFPLLMQQDLVYLDSAATAQRPFSVLDAERNYYERYNANPLRGFYDLAIEATEQYELAREEVKNFIHAGREEEIVFTRNTTESINLVAYSYGLSNLQQGDEILITIAEHHSNMLPWQMVAQRTGAVLKYLECRMDGSYAEEEVAAAITPRTKLAAIQHVSNVLGSMSPVDAIIKKVHQNGGVVLVDGAQSTPHMPIDVQKMDADFFAFSGHKLMAPMGIGVLYGKLSLLEQMPPFMTGGEMIDAVYRDHAVYAPAPHKFEAGTVNGGGAAGLAAAIQYMNSIGVAKIHEIEVQLTRIGYEALQHIPGVHILGCSDPDQHNSILSFTVDGVHPHDVSAILNEDQIAVRAGHHCAQPLLAHLGVSSCTRASISFYNTEEDLMRLAESVSQIRRKMGYGA